MLGGVEPGDGGNWSFLHGIVYGRNFHQPPADDAEDIAETLLDRLGLGGVKLTFSREADAEDEVRSKRGGLGLLLDGEFCRK